MKFEFFYMKESTEFRNSMKTGKNKQNNYLKIKKVIRRRDFILLLR